MERGWKCVVELVALGAILKLGGVVKNTVCQVKSFVLF